MCGARKENKVTCCLFIDRCNATDLFYDNWRQAETPMMLFVGRLRWTLLPKECYSESLSGRGSTPNLPTVRWTLYHWASCRPCCLSKNLFVGVQSPIKYSPISSGEYGIRPKHIKSLLLEKRGLSALQWWRSGRTGSRTTVLNPKKSQNWCAIRSGWKTKTSRIVR